MTDKEMLCEFERYLIATGLSGGVAKNNKCWLATSCRYIPALAGHLSLIAAAKTSGTKIAYANEILNEITLSKNPDILKNKSCRILAAKRFIEFLGQSPALPCGVAAASSDKETAHVVYENSVPADEKIAGLCAHLENEYAKIISFANKTLGTFFQNLAPIPVYLSKERPVKTYYYEREFLMRKITELCKKTEGHAGYCPAGSVLEEYHPFDCDINGRFFSGSEPHIVIYFKNLDPSSPFFLESAAQTLAHEYMHYLHYAFADKKYDAASKKLKEAFADFFAVAYCIEEGYISVANKRFFEWKEHDREVWPYSYALCFFEKPLKSAVENCDINRAIGRFVQVFADCKTPSRALSTLKKL